MTIVDYGFHIQSIAEETKDEHYIPKSELYY